MWCLEYPILTTKTYFTDAKLTAGHHNQSRSSPTTAAVGPALPTVEVAAAGVAAHSSPDCSSHSRPQPLGFRKVAAEDRPNSVVAERAAAAAFAAVAHNLPLPRWST